MESLDVSPERRASPDEVDHECSCQAKDECDTSNQQPGPRKAFIIFLFLYYAHEQEKPGQYSKHQAAIATDISGTGQSASNLQHQDVN